MNLRTVLTLSFVALAALAVATAGALTLLTRLLHRSIDDLSLANEGLRAAEALSAQALARQWMGNVRVATSATSTVDSDALERRLLEQVALSERYVQSEEEGRLLSRAAKELNAYLALRRKIEAQALPMEEVVRQSEPLLLRVVHSLDTLAAVNEAQAAATRERVVYWDRLADVIGMLVAVLLLVGTAGIVIWLRTAAMKPVLALSRAMRSFGGGAREARAPEEGPQEIRELAARFNAMADALARQRETQLNFLAGVAHDLRNPLGALKLAIQRSRMSEVADAPERQKQTLALVDRNLARLDRMTGDLIDVVRLDSGLPALDLQPVDLRELVVQTQQLYAASSERHTLTLDLPESPVVVIGDPVRLSQVVENLVSNALKYSPEGGTVSLGLGRSAAEVRLWVSDEGIGIPDAERERIFEPFGRTTEARAIAPGIGMGLFTARRLVEAHGGRLSATARAPRGTTFWLTLPVAPAAS